MQSSRNGALLRALVVATVAAALLAGCSDSSPTEPKALTVATPIPTPTPTPLPPGGNIAGTWTGSYVSTGWLDCDTSIISPAQATLTQNGSDVRGTLTATGDPRGCPCGKLTFTGTLQGNYLEGTIGLPNQHWGVSGVLSASTLDISLLNLDRDEDNGPYGTGLGRMHLHR